MSLVDARPYGGKKKGADGGIDGILFFRSDRDRDRKGAGSVKGGDNVGVSMVRDLFAVVGEGQAGIVDENVDPAEPGSAAATTRSHSCGWRRSATSG